MPYDSLLIYAYGGPESMNEVPDFIRSVTGGRVSAERLAEVQAHYAHFGGVSPMNGAIREFMRLWRAERPVLLRLSRSAWKAAEVTESRSAKQSRFTDRITR